MRTARKGTAAVVAWRIYGTTEVHQYLEATSQILGTHKLATFPNLSRLRPEICLESNQCRKDDKDSHIACFDELQSNAGTVWVCVLSFKA